MTALTKQHDDEFAKLNPYFLTGLALALLRRIPLSRDTQRAQRADARETHATLCGRCARTGRHSGCAGAVIRYGLLILVTMSFYVLLREVAAVLVLFGVTMWMRNPNMQGLHDRLAHTIVVRDSKD